MKAWVNNFIMLFGMFLISSCEAQTNKAANNKKQVERLSLTSDSAFVSKIKTLSIVVNKENSVGTLEYFIKDTPTKENPFYIIQVGKSNYYRLEIFYNFYCYPKSGNIKLYNSINDTLIEVK
jgi:hypothetical protein